MFEKKGERGNQNKERSREMGIPNEEWIEPSRSAKRTECKRDKNTKRKRHGSVKAHSIQQNKKGKI